MRAESKLVSQQRYLEMAEFFSMRAMRFALVVMSGLAMGSAHAFAPTPADGELSVGSPAVTFTGGGDGVVPNVSPTAGDPVCVTNTVDCDVFTLNISLPADYAATQANDTIKVDVSWDVAEADYDIYAVENGEVIASAASAANPEVFEFPAGQGERTIEIQLVPFLPVAATYTGNATLEVKEPAAPTDLSEGGSVGGDTRVVVSVIDTGINPYHSYFRAGSRLYPGSAPDSVTTNVKAEFGIGPACEITLSDDYDADVAKGVWAAAEACDLVWFTGTNIIARSSGDARPYLPNDNDDTHGVGVTASVLTANPEAVILFLEGTGAASETFAMNHPSVDMVTTSYGPIGSAPLPGNLGDSFKGTYHNGKLHFGACDNSPALAQPDSTCGPWWSIGVAGFEETQDNEEFEASEGRQLSSGSFPDFVADFAQTLPYCDVCTSGTQSVRGTSFSTPRSAGSASRILLEARRAIGHVGSIHIRPGDDRPIMAQGQLDGAPFGFTNWQLRRAMELAAYVPGFEEYDPINGVFDEVAYPVNPVAPWLSISWGVITPDTEHGFVGLSLNALGIADGPVPEKAQDYCDFNNSNIDARKFYWDNVNIGSETFGNPPSPEPYLYCNSPQPTYTNNPPQAVLSLSDAELTVGSTMIADGGASSDPESDRLTYRFDISDGTVREDSSDAMASHAFTAPGTYQVTLTVTDAVGQSSSAVENVTVTGSSTGPSAGFVHAALDSTVNGQTVTFDARASFKCDSFRSEECTDPATQRALSNPVFEFFFRDDTGDITASMLDDDGLIDYTYGAAGTFRPFVVVRDANGNSDAAQTTVTTELDIVVNGPEVQNAARLTADYDRNSPVVPLQVIFDASQTVVRDGFEITSYTFDFGDGNAVTTASATVQHTYVAAGSYSPSVEVLFTESDDTNNTETSSAKSQLVQANEASAPATGSSAAPVGVGGGSGGLGWLTLLPLAIAGLRRRRSV